MSTSLSFLVYLVIKSSATLVPGSGSSKPDNPWRRLADVVPRGMPYHLREDHYNHRYEIISALRMGPKTKNMRNVKIEYTKNGHEKLEIVR
jgi:hypothetical protein